MFKNKIISLFPSIFYIALSLIIGDVHPFSRYEMYNSFPSTALAISATDKNGKLLPIQDYFKYSSFSLLHSYYALLPSVQQYYTNPDSIQYHTVKIVVENMLPYAKVPLPKSIQFHFQIFHTQGSQIQINDKLLFTYVEKP